MVGLRLRERRGVRLRLEVRGAHHAAQSGRGRLAVRLLAAVVDEALALAAACRLDGAAARGRPDDPLEVRPALPAVLLHVGHRLCHEQVPGAGRLGLLGLDGARVALGRRHGLLGGLLALGLLGRALDGGREVRGVSRARGDDLLELCELALDALVLQQQGLDVGGHGLVDALDGHGRLGGV